MFLTFRIIKKLRKYLKNMLIGLVNFYLYTINSKIKNCFRIIKYYTKLSGISINKSTINLSKTGFIFYFKYYLIKFCLSIFKGEDLFIIFLIIINFFIKL